MESSIDPEFFSPQEIMEMDDAVEAVLVIGYHQVGDTVHFHHGQCFCRRLFLVYGPW
jgi:hypothetical protein